MSKFYTGKVNDQWRLIRRTIPTQYYPDRDFQFRVEANFDARIRFVWTNGNYLEIGLGVDRDSAKNGIWANGQLKSESFIPSEEYLTDTTKSNCYKHNCEFRASWTSIDFVVERVNRRETINPYTREAHWQYNDLTANTCSSRFLFRAF